MSTSASSEAAPTSPPRPLADALADLMLAGGADLDEVFDAVEELLWFLTTRVGLTREQALEALR